jgi:predicted RNA-binding Zn-ribbon protein involved in translation (DUF1610 family)
MYKPTNREKSRNAKLGKHWCFSCDAQLVGKSRKCPVCGNYSRNRKRKLKKFL